MTKITSLLLLEWHFFPWHLSGWLQLRDLFVDLNRVNDWQPLHDIDEIRTVPMGHSDSRAADPYIMSRPLYVPRQ